MPSLRGRVGTWQQETLGDRPSPCNNGKQAFTMSLSVSKAPGHLLFLPALLPEETLEQRRPGHSKEIWLGYALAAASRGQLGQKCVWNGNVQAVVISGGQVTAAMPTPDKQPP